MTARRSLDDTRTLLLDAGAQMLTDAGAKVTVGHLNLVDVCRAAGLTTAGSAYKIWDSQEAFRVDLLRHLVMDVIDDTTTIDGITAAVAMNEATGNFTEFVRTAGRENAEAYIGNQAYALYIALWLASEHDPELAEHIRNADGEWIDAFARLFATIGDRYGREFIPPFDAQHLAVALSALVEGFAIRSRIHPDRIPVDLARSTGPDDEPQPWHLFACAAEGIIDAFTRPVEDRSAG